MNGLYRSLDGAEGNGGWGRWSARTGPCWVRMLLMGGALCGAATWPQPSIAAEPPAVAAAANAGQLVAILTATLERDPQYQPGDLISRSQVSACLADLHKRGWVLDDPKPLLEAALPDDDFLLRQLKDNKGREFLKKIQQTPGSIDRLDRLARMPHGQTNVRDLIHKVPNGYEWINAMGTTAHGRRLAKTMENASTGKHFTEPTHRVYTVDALATYLEGKLKAAPPKS